MKNSEQTKQRFYDATDKLIGAFIMGTIFHDGCRVCAVGTLCDGSSLWTRYHDYSLDDKIAKDIAEQKIRQTGYSPIEIYLIEQCFEERNMTLLEAMNRDTELNLDDRNDPDGFKGLCNVFDYLHSIESWTEEESQINLVEMCGS
jgi:hypothetical protein